MKITVGTDAPTLPSDENRVGASKLTSLLPLAVVLLVVGGLVWWLLDCGSAVGPWLVAGILFAHGWVHIVFLLPPAGREPADGGADNPFDLGRSWLIGRGADSRLVHSGGAVLAVMTFVAFAAAALAVVGWLVPGAWWWTGLVLTGVVGSTMLLVLSFTDASSPCSHRLASIEGPASSLRRDGAQSDDSQPAERVFRRAIVVGRGNTERGYSPAGPRAWWVHDLRRGARTARAPRPGLSPR